MARRIFSGIQPSGSAHLGNYLGALRNWVKLQDVCSDVMYSIVDLHALTIPQAPVLLRKNIIDMTSCLLACGVDPQRSIIFQQSQVPAHCELSWILSCCTPMGWLNRMTQWKAKGATDNRDIINLGLFSYPVLMTADILLYRATHVPVGDDQLQHLELARDVARSFNSQYLVEFFPDPKPLLGEVHRVMSLRNPLQKMSKSDNQELSRINLSDTPDQIRNKIRKSVTDCVSNITYDPDTRPGISNLISIYSAITGATHQEVVDLFIGKQSVDLKDALVDIVTDHLKPIRETLMRMEDDLGYVETVLDEGARKAELQATETMFELKCLLGLH